MKYPLIAFGVVAFTIACFALLFTNYSAGPSQQLTEVIATEEIDECYDDTMNAWFIEFNKKQENGATMYDADEKASEIALADYGKCSGKPGGSL